jgi:hypothetical protein
MLKLAPSCFDLPRGSIYVSDCSKLREVARDEKDRERGSDGKPESMLGRKVFC